MLCLYHKPEWLNFYMYDYVMEITYTEHNGIFYPDLALPKQTNYPIGKYGSLRLDFLKKHRRGTYSMLVGECRLNEYLHDIDIQAKEAVNRITAELAFFFKI